MRSVFVLLALVAVASADVWSNCGKPSDILQNLQVTLTPDPPVQGASLTIAASGTFSEELTALTLNYNVEGIITGSLDLCSVLAKTKYPCPIAKGPLSITETFKIPSGLPHIPITAQATVTDQNNNEVACIKIDIEF